MSAERADTMSRTTSPAPARVDARRTRKQWRRGASGAAAWLSTVVVAGAIGIAAAGNRKIGLALAGFVLVFGIFVADPLLLVVIALPGSLLIQRVGGSSTNLSAADLLVFVAAIVSLFHIRWKEAPYLRQFLKGVVWFQAALILVVIAHPFRDDIVEWFHRWSYVAGQRAGRVGHRNQRPDPAGLPPLSSRFLDHRHPGHGTHGDQPLPARPVGRLPEERHRQHHVDRRRGGPDQSALDRDRPHWRRGSTGISASADCWLHRAGNRPSSSSWPSPWLPGIFPSSAASSPASWSGSANIRDPRPLQVNSRAPAAGRPPRTVFSWVQDAPEILVGRLGVPHVELHGLAHLDVLAHRDGAGFGVGAEDAADQEVTLARQSRPGTR